MTIQCPNCSSAEPEGAIFCSDCGANLVSGSGLSTAAIPAPDAQLYPVEPAPPPAEPLQVGSAQINLHIVRTGQIIPLEGRSEFTIGRISEGQSILPDIDLSPYDAYTQGVSRLHATFKINNNEFFIEDLGSSNGTRINNTKIPPLHDQVLHHGDVISLGRFKIQALIRQ
jgi:hypothetical protein